ncbi:uncharacterized protein LOC132200142 isoform X2 [Neocloeon triangulifer]|uniref:uncharacterized protein LOC132200142 isoform X2 n=1 Tax=Neocloeon triangulifer TaxID=2078957 RepID=UPI00286EF755|nr:uncharacterized protein LOC132200142 isoform X2 [Neocloeon triangulifer]
MDLGSSSESNPSVLLARQGSRQPQNLRNTMENQKTTYLDYSTARTLSEESEDDDVSGNEEVPLKIVMEENLTYQRGFDDSSYIISLPDYFTKEEVPTYVPRPSVIELNLPSATFESLAATATHSTCTEGQRQGRFNADKSASDFPYPCNICQAVGIVSCFRSLTLYSKHVLKKHGVSLERQASHTCMMCYKSYKSKSSYLKHIANSHPDVEDLLKKDSNERLWLQFQKLVDEKLEELLSNSRRVCTSTDDTWENINQHHIQDSGVLIPPADALPSSEYTGIDFDQISHQVFEQLTSDENPYVQSFNSPGRTADQIIEDLCQLTIEMDSDRNASVYYNTDNFNSMDGVAIISDTSSNALHTTFPNETNESAQYREEVYLNYSGSARVAYDRGEKTFC